MGMGWRVALERELPAAAKIIVEALRRAGREDGAVNLILDDDGPAVVTDVRDEVVGGVQLDRLAVELAPLVGFDLQLRATRRTQFDRSLDHCYLCLDPLIQVVLRGRFRSDRALAVMERKIHALSQERKFCKVDPSSNRP